MTSQEYRFKAIECLESAPWVHDASAKNTLIELALYWLRLADLHETNRGVRRSDQQDHQQVAGRNITLVEATVRPGAGGPGSHVNNHVILLHA